MEFLLALLLFAGKTLVIVVALLVVILFIALLTAKAQHKQYIEVENLNRHFKLLESAIKSVALHGKDLKHEKKKLKKQLKKEKTANLYVVDFKGDIKASQVELLREEISAILTTATTKDEVVVRVESPGGVVHGYGLAAAQLIRIREANIPLTVCVDKVAASGGYLMACTADKILCAPFGIVGSVGVVAQVPNFHRLLQKNEVDYKEYTAGEFKRTVSIFGEITPKGEQKFVQQLEDTHHLFKNFVNKFRPHLDMHQVATGEYWYGENAKDLGLVDEITTSDQYLASKVETHRLLKIKYEKKQAWSEKFSGIFGKSLEKAFLRIVSELEKSKLI